MKRLLAVLLLAACHDYKYERLAESKEPGSVTRYFTAAHTTQEPRTRTWSTRSYSFWQKKWVTTYHTEHYTEPVFHPDDFKLCCASDHASKTWHGTTAPFNWSAWLDHEACVVTYVPVFRVEIDGKGIPIGERALDHYEFVTMEKVTPEESR